MNKTFFNSFLFPLHRDISALQYDPQAENRSKFELQSDEEENSKAKRIPRKLRYLYGYFCISIYI